MSENLHPKSSGSQELSDSCLAPCSTLGNKHLLSPTTPRSVIGFLRVGLADPVRGFYSKASNQFGVLFDNKFKTQKAQKPSLDTKMTTDSCSKNISCPQIKLEPARHLQILNARGTGILGYGHQVMLQANRYTTSFRMLNFNVCCMVIYHMPYLINWNIFPSVS